MSTLLKSFLESLGKFFQPYLRSCFLKHEKKSRLVYEVRNVHQSKISKTNLEKAMAPHSNTLAWKILWTEEPGRLQSMGLLRVGHD